MKQQQAPLEAKVVLGVAAHPDDLDFGAGGTIAHLAHRGATVYYLILTNGSRGTVRTDLPAGALQAQRQAEQKEAAKTLGAHDVFFLNYQDGELENTREVRKDIVYHIRKLRPDTVITMDPSMLYASQMNFINHPDHRAAGQATLDSVYPLSRDHLSFPEHLEHGLEPHKVKTLLLCNFTDHNYCVDITDTLQKKIEALTKHVSQVGPLEDAQPMLEKMAVEAGRSIGCDKAEPFIRIEIGA